jgi:hypothetical protein
MIRQEYATFITIFGSLNPYELEHVTELVLVKLEELLADRGKEESMQFCVADIKHALTRAMRDLKIELAQERMQEAHCLLCQAQHDTFSPFKKKCGGMQCA